MFVAAAVGSLGVVGVLWVMQSRRSAALGWAFAALAWWGLSTGLSLGASGQIAAWAAFVLAAALFWIAPVRRAVISGPVFAWYRRILPTVSKTEQEALDAGTVWWDGELFSGKPNWQRLLDTRLPGLTPEEQAFVDGPTEELCRMLDDWQITHELADLPPEVWKFIKSQGFFGLVISKEFGGKGFSARAHSEIVMKIATRSASAAVSVMVPNSLGPGELLAHYGTEAQKRHYLPRLAAGLEIPCFALTSPEAGSDAGAIPDRGIVCWGEHEGQRILGMRLTWDKRYITLGPIATLLGLAFKLYDPDHLLGAKEDLGITLALIPTSHPGVKIGRRHFTSNTHFQNGPNSGTDVFIPLDWIIGGPERAGQGWRMLMECLSIGRSISLPALAAGASKLSAYATGAYARVRSQFKTPIGRFEGIEEALARIGGNAYLIDATRVLTASAVDLGQRPSVLSAIAKYHLTERMRSVVNDAMDVHGGKAICLGPNNYIGRFYQAVPFSITVEGANILTRSMMIFGQGAIRCHPHVLDEIAATRISDPAQAVAAFDQAFFKHIGFSCANALTALWHGLTGARTASVPGDGVSRRYFQQLSRLSAGFAFASDVSMLVLGGSLKRREKLSGRLGDALSMLYLASAALKRYHDQGCPSEDQSFLAWGVEDSMYRAQEALCGLIDNFPSRMFAGLLTFLLFPLGKPFRPASDQRGAEIAASLLQPNAARQRLTVGLYAPARADDLVGKIDLAMRALIAGEPLETKLRQARKSGKLHGETLDDLIDEGVIQAVLTAQEGEQMRQARELQKDVIRVDDFPQGFGMVAAPSATLAEVRERVAA